MLAAIWRLVGQLRERRIAHRDLRLANIFVDDGGEVWLIDFGFSEMAASDLLLATDVAELLASSSLYVGADRAVAHAVSAVDRATLSRALRPAAPVGARRRDADSAQVAARLARRAARAASPPAVADVSADGERLVAVRVAGAGLIVLVASVVAKLASRRSARPSRGCSTPSTGCPTSSIRSCGCRCSSATSSSARIAGLVVAIVDGDLAVAVGVVLAMVLKLVTERVVRKEMADYLAVRQRPGTSQVGAVLRGGDVPSTGPSFPSGHVILVAAVGTVVAPILPTAWWWVPALLTAPGDGRARLRRRPQPTRRHRRARCGPRAGCILAGFVD